MEEREKEVTRSKANKSYHINNYG